MSKFNAQKLKNTYIQNIVPPVFSFIGDDTFGGYSINLPEMTRRHNAQYKDHDLFDSFNDVNERQTRGFLALLDGIRSNV